jgi:hypothetical protein
VNVPSGALAEDVDAEMGVVRLAAQKPLENPLPGIGAGAL